jgi:glucan biosynthesis protein
MLRRDLAGVALIERGPFHLGNFDRGLGLLLLGRYALHVRSSSQVRTMVRVIHVTPDRFHSRAIRPVVLSVGRVGFRFVYRQGDAIGEVSKLSKAHGASYFRGIHVAVPAFP